MDIAVLGPLEVYDGTAAVEVSGVRLRALLTMLALEAPRPVSSATLVEALWGDEPPADTTNALQSLVSRLRRALGDGRAVQQSGAGYRLEVEPAAIDVHRFEALAASGRAALRAGDPEAARADLSAALALWRGDPLDALESGTAAGLRARLDEQRLEARADLAESEIALGHAAAVVAELEALVAEHPLRERYAELLVRALHHAGRPAEALASYERARATLADELGVDPSPDLQAAHLAVLRGEAAAAAEESAAHQRGNLRATLTSFVGRDEQLVQIGNLLETSRLVTLVGPGGAGKTRLAVAAGGARHDGAVWLAELAPVTDPADVPQTVLGALGVRDAILIDRAAAGPRDTFGRLVDALSGRNVLLVLDNCEHLIDAAAQLADQLLAACPDLRILATSREPLAIFGETLIAVPPLDLPSADVEPKEALSYAAVQLFADRARDARPDFEIDGDTVAPVAEIVRRLDGLPLAIELAAARLRTLPVAEIERRLSDRFRLLTGGSRTAMPRHRTLHAVVEWSWDLLGDDERTLARRLAVFSGGVTPEAAAAICADALDPAAVDELLASLVDKSLLQIAPTFAPTPRYRMLETIREFGLERMAEAGEVGTVRLAHATYFADVVTEAEPHLRTAEQLPWIALLEFERDNILAAIKYFGDVGRAQDVMDFASRLGWHWMTNGNHGDIVTWVTFALAVPGEVAPNDRLMAEALLAVNTVAWNARVGDSDDITEGMARLHEISGAITALVNSGEAPDMLYLLAPIVAMFVEDVETAQRLSTQALKHDDRWVAAAIRVFRGAMAENVGDAVGMRADAEAAVAAFREIGERWGMANGLQLLGQVELMEGNVLEAAAAYREALDLAVAIASREDIAGMRLRLAEILTRLGDLDGAREQAALGRIAADSSGSPLEAMFITFVEIELARSQGRLDGVDAKRDEGLRVLRAMPEVHPIRQHGLAILLATGAKLDLDRGRPTNELWSQLDEAYDNAIETKDTPIVAAVAVAVALALVTDGALEQAAEILGAAVQLRGAEDLTQLDIVTLDEKLGGLHDGPYAVAYERGRAMTREQAIARADPRQARLL